MRSLVALVFAVSSAVNAAMASTSVDCDTPDDFCTGDPCETSDSLIVTVATCTLDFGSRTLILDHKVLLPSGSTMALTAAAIEVNQKIDGVHTTQIAGDGADVTLIAAGDIAVRKRIDVSGDVTAGTIALQAGGTATLDGPLRSRARSNAATGGTVSVQAAQISSLRRGKIDVRGKRNNTVGGQVQLSATGALTVDSRIDARGKPGGAVTLVSSTGTVSLDESIRIEGQQGGGGSLEVDAAADIVDLGRAYISAGGDGAPAGEVSLTAGAAIDAPRMLVTARGLVGGSVAAVGGSIDMGRLTVRGGDAGSVRVESTSGDVAVLMLDGRAQGTGGSFTVDSAADAAIGEVEADGQLFGGTATLHADGNLSLGDSSGDRFNVSGDTSGGSLVASAGGDLTAEGNFTAATGGCIALTAGGTLDTSAAIFDVTPTGSCP